MKSAVSEKPKSAIESLIRYPYIYFPLHETSGATMTDRGYSANNGGLSVPLFDAENGSPAIQGTTTGIWANEGFVTLQGDNYISLLTDAERAFSRLDNLNGQLLVAFRAEVAAAPTVGPELIVEHSHAVTTGGGWGIQLINSAGSPQLRAFYTPDGGSNSALAQYVMTPGTPVNVMYVFDMVASVCRVYIDGQLWASPALQAGTKPSLHADYGLTIFAKQQTHSPATFGNHLNEWTSGFKGSDLFICRITEDRAADLQQIAMDLTNYVGELPWLLTQAA